MAWVPWLGFMEISGIFHKSTNFPPLFEEKVTFIRITIKVYGESLVNLIIH